MMLLTAKLSLVLGYLLYTRCLSHCCPFMLHFELRNTLGQAPEYYQRRYRHSKHYVQQTWPV